MKAAIVCVLTVVVMGCFAELTGAMITTDPECHRLRTKVDKVRMHCVYLCHMPEGYIRMGVEEDGTPCRFFVHEGVCERGICHLAKPRKGGPTKDDGGEKKDSSEEPKDDKQ